MTRKGFLLILAVCLTLPVCSVGLAQTSLTASATISGPSGVTPVAIRVTVPPGTNVPPSAYVWDTTSSASLNFDPLVLKAFTASGTEVQVGDPQAKFLIFLSDHFYSIDMAYTYGGGAAITRILFEYTDVSPPQTAGLGSKATATFVRKYFANGAEAPETINDRTAPGKLLLSNAGGTIISLSQLNGGWLRVYVGLVTKNPALPAGDVELLSSTTPFVPGDAPGTYEGRITITSLP